MLALFLLVCTSLALSVTEFSLHDTTSASKKWQATYHTCCFDYVARFTLPSSLSLSYSDDWVSMFTFRYIHTFVSLTPLHYALYKRDFKKPDSKKRRSHKNPDEFTISFMRRESFRFIHSFTRSKKLMDQTLTFCCFLVFFFALLFFLLFFWFTCNDRNDKEREKREKYINKL